MPIKRDKRVLRAVKLFRKGRWRGEQYDSYDLHTLAESAKGQDLPVTLRHQGKRIGSLKNLRVEGSYLLGDLHLDEDGAAKVYSGELVSVSLDTDWNATDAFLGHKCIGVALLPEGERPAVEGLGTLLDDADIHAYRDDADVHSYRRRRRRRRDDAYAAGDDDEDEDEEEDDEDEDDEDADRLYSIRAVPIFKAGVWNNDRYSLEDLDSMVSAFGELGFKPPVKLGHSRNVGERAYGFITALRRRGDFLVADLSDVPGFVYRVIKERGYDAVSAEVAWNFTRNGKKYSRALVGLALLGSEIPAVDLPPLRATVHSDFADCERRIYTMTRDLDHTDPGAALVALAKRYALEHPQFTFSTALAIVRETEEGRALLRQYGANTGAPVTRTFADDRRSSAANMTASEASEKLHTAAMRLMESEACRGYSEAAARAVRENPELAAAWGAS